jgi:Protein of unknown function (DUF3667)
MSGEIEAIADAVTGTVAGRAVEPLSGEACVRNDSAEICLNCGAALATPYCGQCGQNSHVHRSLSAFWHDFLHSIIHFEGKAWRTLPLLAFRPGQLTRRYIHGERAKFISPLALFLFSVFLMFAAFSWVGGPMKMNPSLASPQQARAAIAKDIATARDRLKALEAERATAEAGAQGALDGRIEGVKGEIGGLETALSVADASKGGVLIDNGIDLGNSELNEKVKHALENPSLLLYKLQTNAYKFSWLLIPLSLPFLWAMFALRRDLKLYDHLIFITYSLCFMTLLLVVATVAGAVPFMSWLKNPLLAAAPPIHMFAQLKGAYGLTIGSAVWRTVWLMFSALIVTGIFAFALLAMGLG